MSGRSLKSGPNFMRLQQLIISKSTNMLEDTEWNISRTSVAAGASLSKDTIPATSPCPSIRVLRIAAP